MLSRFVLALGLFGIAGSTLFAFSGEREWSIRSEETIRKTLPLSGPPMRVVIDNIEGNIHVFGYSGNEVRVSAHRTVRAETEADAKKANEVQLEISGEPGSVSVYYAAPWRCDHHRNGCEDHEGRRFYSVTFDIDVQVPQEARVVASTINGGDLRVDDVNGNFDAANINGPVMLNGMGGSGDAHTINGPVSVRFSRNPSAACKFNSINGSIDVYFPQDLSADLRFKTFQGEIYSDFEVTAMATSEAGTPSRSGNKFVYRSDRAQSARAGSGGPQMSFDTLNGSIRLHRSR